MPNFMQPDKRIRGMILKRIVISITLLLGVSFLTFLMIRMIPGDPAEVYMRMSYKIVTEEGLSSFNEKWGLDQPLLVQFVTWLLHVLRLEFGTSFVSNQDIWPELSHVFVATLQLTAVALILAILVSLPLGFVAALYPNHWIDQVSRLVVLIGATIPTFCLGYLLIIFLSVKLDWFPMMGRGSWQHFVLPAVTLALPLIAVYTRLLRASILEQLNQPYILFARMRGLKRRTIMGKHLLRMSVLPCITVIGIDIGSLLSGAIIVENVFAWNGIGRYFVTAIANRDYPVIQACVLLMSFVYILCNLLVDLLYLVLDPKIRWKKGAEEGA